MLEKYNSEVYQARNQVFSNPLRFPVEAGMISRWILAWISL